MHFTAADRESEFWMRFTEYLRAELQKLRERNDHPMPDDQRNQLIGEIARIKATLALGQPKRTMLDVVQERV